MQDHRRTAFKGYAAKSARDALQKHGIALLTAASLSGQWCDGAY